MSYAIRGRVLDASNPSQPLGNSTVRFILEVGAEFNARPAGTSATASPWSAYSDSAGYFTIPLKDGEVDTILGSRRHREIIFKVYGYSGIILACQSVYVSMATFRGTEVVTLEADPTTIPTAGSIGFSIAGLVVEADGTPIASTAVQLSEKKLRSTTPFPSVMTDAAGRFIIRYDARAARLNVASLSVILTAAGVDATAGDFCNPPSEFTARLVRGNAPYAGRSQFALDLATLSPLLDTATLDELGVDDLKFLRCRTQHDSSVVATLVRAHALADQFSLPAAAFAALASAGIPLSTIALTALGADEIAGAIDQAIAANLVPSTLAAQIPAIVATLAAARIDRVVPAASPATTPIGAILVAAGVPATKPRLFAEAYVAHTGTAEEFWEGLRSDGNFGPDLVATIQFSLQTGAISGGHSSLVKLLGQKRKNGDFAVVAELAQYNEPDWIGFMAQVVDGNPVHTPSGFVGGSDTEKRANYAAAITGMIADLFPSAHLAFRLPPGSVTSDVTAFILQNPTLSFDRTNISEFLPTASGLPPLPADQETLRRDLLKVQRVFAVSPRFGRTSVAATLLDAGVSSAAQIHNMAVRRSRPNSAR
jgi:hypothetical protein